MSIESIIEAVRTGLHLKDNTQIPLPRDSKDNISTYIDLIKYGTVNSVDRWLEPEFAKAFRALSPDQKVTLSLIDNQHVLSAAVICELMEKDYSRLFSSPCDTTREMALAIAIAFEDTRVLTNADNSLLYRYFVSAKVTSNKLAYFSNVKFISLALNKILNEERVIFTWIVQNITTMIQASLIEPSQHRFFFKDLFDKYSYIQGEQETLFLVAVAKDIPLFDLLQEVRLSIDPFTKQTNYSLWLRDGAKFLFLEKLRSLEGITATKRVSEFDRKLQLFKDINKFDRSFIRRPTH